MQYTYMYKSGIMVRYKKWGIHTISIRYHGSSKGVLYIQYQSGIMVHIKKCRYTYNINQVSWFL